MWNADRVGGLGLLAFAAVVIRESLRLPYWADLAPGPGFLPLWFGILLAVGAVPLVAGRGAATMAVDRLSRRDRGRLAVLVILAAGAAALVPRLGMVSVAGLFTLAVLFLLAPHRRGGNAVAAVLVPAVVWVVFLYWLRVPLPVGPLGF